MLCLEGRQYRFGLGCFIRCKPATWKADLHVLFWEISVNLKASKFFGQSPVTPVDHGNPKNSCQAWPFGGSDSTRWSCWSLEQAARSRTRLEVGQLTIRWPKLMWSLGGRRIKLGRIDGNQNGCFEDLFIFFLVGEWKGWGVLGWTYCIC